MERARETAPFVLHWHNRSRYPVRALPNHIRRNARQDDADVDRERLRLRHEIVAKQKQRAGEKDERDKRIAPRSVRPPEPRPRAAQHEDARDGERVERPDTDDELV